MEFGAMNQRKLLTSFLIIVLAASMVVDLLWLRFPHFVPLAVVIATTVVAGVVLLVGAPMAAVGLFSVKLCD